MKLSVVNIFYSFQLSVSFLGICCQLTPIFTIMIDYTLYASKQTEYTVVDCNIFDVFHFSVKLQDMQCLSKDIQDILDMDIGERKSRSGM